jgi:adenylosuccinate synthase
VTREAWVVFDLGFGDAGKGATVDFLVRERAADLVVRFNGGAQAGHTVVLPDRRRHTFAQFGAGTFVPGVQTYLGPKFLLHPGGLAVEALRLERQGINDAVERTRIDARAPVISPFQQAAGRLRELLRGEAAHGTCGVGIGERVADASEPDAIVAADLSSSTALRERLAAQQARKREALSAAADLDGRARPEWELLCDPSAVERILESWLALRERLHIVSESDGSALLRAAEAVVCEGAQGVLLDQTWGFHPHTTWSDCTPAGALELLAGIEAPVFRLGVLRTYATRHGAGPFPTHDPSLSLTLREPHNPTGPWQGPFRCGALDAVTLRYALEVSGGVDGLALTCLDRIPPTTSVCASYRGAGAGLELDAEGLARRIVPGDAADLEARAALGETLREVEPVLERVARQDLCTWVDRELRAPIWIESRGPQAEDRDWTAPGRETLPPLPAPAASTRTQEAS